MDYHLVNAARSASSAAGRAKRGSNDPEVQRLAKALQELADAVAQYAQKSSTQ